MEIGSDARREGLLENEIENFTSEMENSEKSETVSKNENECPFGKTYDELNDTVSNSDLSSGDVEKVNEAENENLMEKRPVQPNNTSDNKDFLSTDEVEIFSDTKRKSLLENEVENLPLETENTEKYHTNAFPQGDLENQNSQAQELTVKECAKREVGTKVEENCSSKETDNGEVITKSGEVDSHHKNRESPAEISFDKSEPSVANSVATSVASIESAGKLETPVSAGGSVQTCTKNPEFPEGNGFESL